MNILTRSTGNRFPSSHRAIVDMSLEVFLRQIYSLATLNSATHEERTLRALFNSLHRITTSWAFLISFFSCKKDMSYQKTCLLQIISP